MTLTLVTLTHVTLTLTYMTFDHDHHYLKAMQSAQKITFFDLMTLTLDLDLQGQPRGHRGICPDQIHDSSYYTC